MSELKFDIRKLHFAEIEILNYIVEICNKEELEYFLIGGTLLGAVRHKGFIPWDDDLDIAMPRNDYRKFINLFKEKYINEKYSIDYINNNKYYWLPFIKIRNNNTIYQEKWQKDYNGEKGIWVDIFPLDNASKKISVYLEIQEYLIKKIKGLLYIKNLRQLKKEDVFLKKLMIKLVKKIPNGLLHVMIEVIMKSGNNRSNEYFVNFGSQYGIKKQTHLKEKYLPAVELEFEGKWYKVPNDYDYVLKSIYGNEYMQLPPMEKRVTHNPIKIIFDDGEEINFEEI